MQYIKKDLGSFNLHLIQTNKFKTITTRIIFHTPIIKEEITKRLALSDILLQSSKNYKTKKALTIKAEDLYACDISTNNIRLGNYILTSFTLDVLNDKYTEENNLDKAFDFLSEIIYKPDIKNNEFREDKLEIVKHNISTSINSIKEDPTTYSIIRMNEAYDKDSPSSYRMIGYLDDLYKVTPKNLYECYEKMIENDYVDIFIVGDFDSKEMTSLVKKYFKFKKIKKRKSSYYLKNPKVRSRRLFAKETMDNNQSKLSIACPLIKLTDYELNYPLVLANIIFGGSPDSKLFREVREENSLCYTIRSLSSKLDNLLVITAGIDKINYDKTIDLISKNLKDMQKGHFKEEDINIAKEYYHTSQEEIEDSPYSLINEALLKEVLKIEDKEERLKKMNKVTKRQIIKVCKKIKMDTVFLLEGVNNEEE